MAWDNRARIMDAMNMNPAINRTRHQRLSGHARVLFGANGIADIYQRAPSRLLFPVAGAGNFRWPYR
jgi:urease accessory protein